MNVADQNEMPLVTLAIPSFNHAAYVKLCIESVISQDYANIELIIIDDGSGDDSVSVINALIPACQQRFRRFEFRSRPNKGLTTTLNEALAWAEGEYFSVLSSDDVLFPDKTSKLLASISDEADVAGVFSGCEYIDGDGILIGAENHPLAYFAFNDVLAHRHFLQTPTQLLRTACLREAGGYLDGVYIEDWYMWLKLTEVGHKLKNIPDNLVQYRYHATNISKQRQHMFEARKQILGHFSQHKGYRHPFVWLPVPGIGRQSRLPVQPILRQGPAALLNAVFRGAAFRGSQSALAEGFCVSAG
jgi:alpha-1,3-rhamnosyltransferase